MLRVFLSQELYSDDIYYASFFNDGFYSFLKKARDHFESFNGRNLVHSIIWCSLALGRAFTALLTAGVFFSIPTVFAYGEGKKIPFSHIAFFAALTMALSPVILKESLFWTSGFFNYVFPLLCIIITIFLQKYLCENKVSIYIIILLCPVFFLLSATTEQAGASAVFAAVFCAIVYLIYNRGKEVCSQTFMPLFDGFLSKKVCKIKVVDLYLY